MEGLAGLDAGDEGSEQLLGGGQQVLPFAGAASTGLRQATSRSAGKSGEVISARSCWPDRVSWSGPSPALSLRMAGARSAVIHP